jgi:hypothetical protein
MQVHCQPQSAFRYTPNGVGHASTQEQIVAGLELERPAGDFEDGVALKKNYPFILGLHILARSNGSRTYDSLDNEIPVSNECLGAFARRWRSGIGK